MTLLAIGSSVTGLLALVFAGYLWPYRDRPGGMSFIALMASIGAWAFTYAVALLVFDPLIRLGLELLIWVSVSLVTAAFFLFGLTYAGRDRLLRSNWTAVAIGLLVVGLIPVLTNPLHGLAWHGFEIDPVFGSATVSYAPAIGLFFFIGWGFILVGAGMFFLVETFLSYGSPFRGQTLSLVASALPPSITQLVWLLGIGPYPQLNLTPFAYPLTIGLLAYAFFRRDLFDLTPVARRAGERTAIDNLGTSIVILDDNERIVNLNGEAERVLGADTTNFGDSLSNHVPTLDIGQERQTLEILVAGQRRIYAVTTSTATDTSDGVVGYTVVFQDVTVERRQRQQLSVLNRALRHNLRNNMNVIQGYLGIIANATDNPEQIASLARVRNQTEELLDLAEQAKESEQLLDAAAGADERVEVAPLLGEIAADIEVSDGTVTVDVPDGVMVRGNERVLARVFRNIIENGLEHNTANTPRVMVDHESINDHARFSIRDNGPGIPEHEVAALDQLEETPLKHSSGIGLWVTVWILEQLGGDIEFDTDSVEGTSVVIDLPTPSETGIGV